MNALHKNASLLTASVVVIGLVITSVSGVIASGGIPGAAAPVASKCCAEVANPCCGASCCPTPAPNPERSPLQTERVRFRIDELRAAEARWTPTFTEVKERAQGAIDTHGLVRHEGHSLQLMHIRLQI